MNHKDNVCLAPLDKIDTEMLITVEMNKDIKVKNLELKKGELVKILDVYGPEVLLLVKQKYIFGWTDKASIKLCQIFESPVEGSV